MTYREPIATMAGFYKNLADGPPRALRSVEKKPMRRKIRRSVCRLRRQTALEADVSRRSKKGKGELVERSDFATFGKQFCQSGFQGGSFDHQSGRNLLIVGIFGK